MNYYVLDTDHLSILQRRSEPAFSKLSAKLSRYSPDLIFVTIVSFQEQFQGWMARINQVASVAELIFAYREMERLIQYFGTTQILPYDQKAADIAENLKHQRIRIGTLDLRIASIVLSENAILLTRNQRDFGKVPNLRIEDWTL
ncbi:MAG: type II toxin-antitoxin system VapC family toxin [candidate division KSB1 bacterium]|nr:type II toxin-antitoxin system VapC family toxin [candidate division KSB1 bacterium]MDZ7367186.1 type II toxin-antitoxin system VapC family toxin [candidate division KSB1 bacterium]MDZ7405331.1 type II toxin-antitoxin system VapC family toxin [candidate division KSB1 bacterium]